MKKVSLALMLLFMAGCSFNGIMPEHYDGRKVEKNMEAIEQYSENNRIVTEDLSGRYPFINSTEVIDSTDREGEPQTLEPGDYTAGGGIAPGRYQITVSEETTASAVVIQDSEDIRILELSLGYETPTAVIELKEGYTVSFKTRIGSLQLEPAAQEMIEPAPDGTIQMPPGIFEAGSHIAPGSYQLMSEALPLLTKDGEPEIYWNLDPSAQMSAFPVDGSEEENAAANEPEVIVDIGENDMIVTEYPITLRKE